jgi:hypothetical protein
MRRHNNDGRADDRRRSFHGGSNFGSNSDTDVFDSCSDTV